MLSVRTVPHDRYSAKRLARDLGVAYTDLLDTLLNNDVELLAGDRRRGRIIRRAADVATAVAFYTDDRAERADAAAAACGANPVSALLPAVVPADGQLAPASPMRYA